MMIEQDTVELRWIFSVIWNRLWLIAGYSLLAGIAAWIVISNMDPTYQATAILYVKPADNSMTSEYSALIAAERLALTYSELLTGRPVLEQVITELDLNITPEQLNNKVSVKPIQDTQLIQLSVADISPERAAQIANQLAISFVTDISTMVSEGYAFEIDEYQTQILALNKRIRADQNQINQLQAQIISAANKLDQFQTSLVENRDNARMLEQDLQEIQLSIAQAMGKVLIFESAEPPGSSYNPPYTATVLLLISPELTASGNDYSSIMASERLTETYAQMLMSRRVLAEAIDQLGLTQSVNRLEQSITAEPIANTQLIQLRVRDDDPDLAIDLANVIARVFVSQTQNSQVEPFISRQKIIESQLDDLEDEKVSILGQIEETSDLKSRAEIQVNRLEMTVEEDIRTRQNLNQDLMALQQLSIEAADAVFITELASIPLEPSSNRLLYLGLAILIGGAIGAGCAFLLEYLDDTIKTYDDVAKLLGVDMLGKIGSFTNKDGQLSVVSDPRSPVAEAFRVLATNIKFASMDQSIECLMITSPSSREGKSAILANLAVTIARTEASVVAIDADLRLPTLHKLFGIKQSDGLTEALMTGNLSGKLQDGAAKDLRILTSGNLPPNPTEVIGSIRMSELLRELKHDANLVIIDCPPILPVADAAILASLTEGAILVVRTNQTGVRAAREALQCLHKSGTKVIGVVLNDVPALTSGYYRYAYNQIERLGKEIIPKFSGKLANLLGIKSH